MLSFVPNKEEFSIIWVQFGLLVDIHDRTEAKHECKHSVLLKSPLMQRKHTAGYLHQSPW